MKTIEEKAREYLNSQLTKVYNETVNGLILYYFQSATVDGYIKGHEEGKAEANAEWQEKIKSILHTIGFIIDMHGQIDTESKLIELYRHLDKLTCEE